MLVKMVVWIEPWVSSKLVTWVCDKVCDNVTDSTDERILFSFQLQSFKNNVQTTHSELSLDLNTIDVSNKILTYDS